MFFIVGRGKSGTSWLMNTLDEHPEILCGGEGRFFGRDPEKRTIQGGSLQQAISGSEALRAWAQHSVWTRSDDTDARIADLAGTVVKGILWGELQRSGKRIVGDKTPSMGSGAIREIAAACPGAKVIHMVRDGRDVAVSSTHHVWNSADRAGRPPLPDPQREARDAYRADPAAFLASGRSIFTRGRLEKIAERWVDTTAGLRREGRTILGDAYAEVRYEDLLTSGEAELVSLFGFLGGEASTEIAANCLQATDFTSKTRGRKPGEEDSRAFLRKGVAGDWQNVFTDDDRETFKRVGGELLIELGYESDLDW